MIGNKPATAMRSALVCQQELSLADLVLGNAVAAVNCRTAGGDRRQSCPCYSARNSGMLTGVKSSASFQTNARALPGFP